MTAIRQAATEAHAEAIVIYSANTRRQTQMQMLRGPNILKMSNGTTSKVVRR